MKDLITELKKLETRTLNNLKLSKAQNTMRAYRSDFNDFASFCVRHNLQSIPTNQSYIFVHYSFI